MDRLHFQFPGTSTEYLQEVLLEACDGATTGGGVFAWCNRPGSEALFEDVLFDKYLKRGNPFQLIVGADSITSEDALLHLGELSQRFSGFKPRVLLHSRGSTFFHPKFTWFERGRSLITVVGSGNLTLGGLRRNWEATVFNTWTGLEADSRRQEIGNYLRQLEPFLHEVGDEAALDRARRNTSAGRAARDAAIRQARTALATAGDKGASGEEIVLFAQVPKADERWSQANFDKASFEYFFGANPKAQSRIILRQALSGGRIGRVESRPSVSVKSHNYRFELAGAKGKAYPREGRPIVVVLRRAPRDFVYQLLMPGEKGYQETLAHMDANHRGRRGPFMWRFPQPRVEAQTALPNLELWRAALAAAADEQVAG